MAINRAQLVKELVPGLHALFGLEYERYKLDDDIDPDMDVASVSVQYMF